MTTPESPTDVIALDLDGPLPEWVTMRNTANDATARFPGKASVVKSMLARDWVVIADPPPAPALPIVPVADGGEPFSPWRNPRNDAVALFPNTIGGMQAARDSGWVPVEPAAPAAVPPAEAVETATGGEGAVMVQDPAPEAKPARRAT